MGDEEIQSVAKQAEAHYDWLKDQVHLQYDEIQELKERLDKAIEYIEKFIPIDNDTILMRENQRDYLLEILKGSDKE